MRFVVIPNTELRVSQVALGSTDLGSLVKAPETFTLLDEFMTLGGNFIDTAHVYANWIPGTNSISETTIGQWMKARGNRDQIVISTKGGHPALSAMHVSRLSRAEITQDLNESLEHLQTDRIELYWLHRDDPMIPVSQLIDTLNEQVEAGKIHYFGASNWTVNRIQAANAYATDNGLHGFVGNQPLWSLAAPNMDTHPDKTLVAMNQEGFDFHRKTGMAVMPYTSQAHGFFTKLDASGRSSIPNGDLMLYDNPTNLNRLEFIRKLAHQHAVAINDIVLSYLLSQPFPTIPILGSKRVDQLHSSLKALEVSLSPSELAYLESG